MARLSLLLLTTTLSFGAVPALAQWEGQPPRQVEASAEPRDLPSLRPEEVAADVFERFNERTGVAERVAPAFDPFEEFDDMAAEVSLRTTTNARDLNGRLLVDGALLDVTLFYTREGETDYARTRDALFLNGEPVPIVLRDSRTVECSSRVTETVYLHDRYYGGYHGYGGLTRRRPAYYGFRGFSIGFGSHYGGYGYDYGYPSGYGYNSGFGYGGYTPVRRRPHTSDRRKPKPSATPRVYDVNRYDSSDDSGRNRPRSRRDYRRDSDVKKPRSATSKPRTSTNVQPTRRTDRRSTARPGAASSDTTLRPDRRVAPNTRTRRTPATGRPQPVTRDTAPARVKTPDRKVSRPPVSRPRPDMSRNSAPQARPSAPPASKRASTPPPKRVTPPPSRPAPARNSSSSSRAPKPSKAPRVSRRSMDRASIELFPQDYAYGDSVVVSGSRDCAREDRITVFIPNERLDAARFDGLTLILRDITENSVTGQTTVYDERPLFIPPNYIDGFRMATSRP